MITTDKEDLMTVLLDHQRELAEMGVRRLAVFGSFVRGEATPESDIDLLVAFEPGQKTFDNFMRLSFFLEDILGRPVDLVTEEALSPYIGPYIRNEAEYVPLNS